MAFDDLEGESLLCWEELAAVAYSKPTLSQQFANLVGCSIGSIGAWWLWDFCWRRRRVFLLLCSLELCRGLRFDVGHFRCPLGVGVPWGQRVYISAASGQ